MFVLMLSGIQTQFVNQKSLLPTFITCFSTTQYPFRILYLSIQIQMIIVYHKTGFTDFYIKNKSESKYRFLTQIGFGKCN